MSIYNASMLLLSVYVVIVLALSIVSNWSDSTVQLLDRVDLAICLIFLTDWFVFFLRSKDKKTYAKTRWLDLVSSIPLVDILRGFRIVRVVRLVRALRLLRGLKGVIPILRVITKNRQRAALTTYLLCTSVIYLYCSLGMLNFERGINDKINTYGDALWACFTTMTSVGYGDIYPITTGGRMMAVLLVVTGLGLFSLVTAEIATLFVKFVQEDDKSQ